MVCVWCTGGVRVVCVLATRADVHTACKHIINILKNKSVLQI